MKASELRPESRFFGMFIGRSKSGKTVAEASFPKPMIIYDGDMRAEGIYAGRKWLPELDQIEIKRFPPSKGFSELEKELELLKIQIQGKQSNIKTIVIDSITSLNRMFITDAHALVDKGRKVGNVRMSGPADYGYEAEACYQMFDYLRSFPINVIVSAHIVDVYGKIDPSKEYSDSQKIGEKLSIRDKIGENVQIYFNEVYRFSKEEDIQGKVRHYVQFRSDIAGTCYASLPDGKIDVTGKNFYEEWKGMIKEND